MISIKRKIRDKDILEKIADIAFGRGNDAVKLAFFDSAGNGVIAGNGNYDGDSAGGDGLEVVDRLDLTMLSEVKRGSNGTVEIKLLNRLDALELLAKLIDCGGGRENNAKDFFAALDTAARGKGSGEGGCGGG